MTNTRRKHTVICFSKWLARQRKRQNAQSNIQACKKRYFQCIGKSREALKKEPSVSAGIIELARNQFKEKATSIRKTDYQTIEHSIRDARKNKNHTDAWFPWRWIGKFLIFVALSSSVAVGGGGRHHGSSVEEILFSGDGDYDNFHEFMVVRERSDKKPMFHFALTLERDMKVNLNRQSDEKGFHIFESTEKKYFEIVQ